MSGDREARLVGALEAARHELTTLHGLVVCDGAAPEETWSIDASKALGEMDALLKASEGERASGPCKDCRFWHTDLNPEEGICHLLGDWPYRYKPGPSAEGYPEQKAAAVPFLSPGGAIEAAFHADPDFGCRQWEARP